MNNLYLLSNLVKVCSSNNVFFFILRNKIFFLFLQFTTRPGQVVKPRGVSCYTLYNSIYLLDSLAQQDMVTIKFKYVRGSVGVCDNACVNIFVWFVCVLFCSFVS